MLKSRHVRSTTPLCGIASKTKVSVGDTHGFSHGFIASEVKPRHNECSPACSAQDHIGGNPSGSSAGLRRLCRMQQRPWRKTRSAPMRGAEVSAFCARLPTAKLQFWLKCMASGATRNRSALAKAAYWKGIVLLTCLWVDRVFSNGCWHQFKFRQVQIPAFGIGFFGNRPTSEQE